MLKSEISPNDKVRKAGGRGRRKVIPGGVPWLRVLGFGFPADFMIRYSDFFLDLIKIVLGRVAPSSHDLARNRLRKARGVRISTPNGFPSTSKSLSRATMNSARAANAHATYGSSLASRLLCLPRGAGLIKWEA